MTLTFESVDEIKLLQNEICKLGRNFPLATFGSERVNNVACGVGLQVTYTVPQCTLKTD